MKVRILDPAKDDLADGFWFYETLNYGLGTYFLDTLYAEIDLVGIYAGIHPIYDPPYFQKLSRKFPYAIYYLIENNEILIEAVIDRRRDPDWISERLN